MALNLLEAPFPRRAESDFSDCAADLVTIARGGSSTDMANLKSVCSKIATQSKGMFLWLKLLIKYLVSPALSPNERLEAVSGVHHLEDIDALYLSILDKVVKKCQKEKHVALNIFRWLVFALCPLSINSLHAALTQSPGRPTSNDDRLVDFAASIDRITCALVETDARGLLRFISTLRSQTFCKATTQTWKNPDCRCATLKLHNLTSPSLVYPISYMIYHEHPFTCQT